METVVLTGHGSRVFCPPGLIMMQDGLETDLQVSEEQGRALISLARQVIRERLGLDSGDQGADALAVRLRDAVFRNRRGTFVTLKEGGRLRGCIGSLSADETILAGVERNAVDAAFHDPRFSPLSVEEIDTVDIEVSILTEARPLVYQDADDLLAKLRVNVDGVIIKKGPARATFLPQVWKQLPRPEEFLSHLCLKAGLPVDEWRVGKPEIFTYQVQYFNEAPITETDG